MQTVWEMQVKAFSDLLEKYQDYDISPAAESFEKVMARFQQFWTTYYFITADGEPVGGILLSAVSAARRDAIRNYFPLPNEIFSLDLTTGELATYAYLLYIENRESYQCRVSYATIGRAIRRGKKTVMRYVGGLVEKRLVTVEPTLIYPAGEKPRNGSIAHIPQGGTAMFC